MFRLKNVLSMGLMVGLLQCGTAFAAETTVLVDNKTVQEVTAQEMVASMKDCHAVFFGEFHNQDILHQVEFELLKEMYAQYGDRLVLSMEMFEANAQENIDKYFADEITEEEFLATSRPWPRYKTDYRHLIEFAKAHHIHLIGANVPKAVVVPAVHEGIEAVPVEDRKYLPRKTTAPEGAYKEKFCNYMLNMQSAMKIKPEMLDRAFAHQCTKDDKMAESIFDYLNEHQDSIVFHINGCFHSDSHLGTVERLHWRGPQLNVAVISSKDLPQNGDFRSVHAENERVGEYIVYFTRVPKEGN